MAEEGIVIRAAKGRYKLAESVKNYLLTLKQRFKLDFVHIRFHFPPHIPHCKMLSDHNPSAHSVLQADINWRNL